MKKIKLPGGWTVKIDDDDYEVFKNFKWQYQKPGYAMRIVNVGPKGKRKSKQQKIYMHRQIMFPYPSKFEVDHINGDGLDNRKDNLRAATRSENAMNRELGLKAGVYLKESGNWCARIHVYGKAHNLGTFPTKQIAQQERAKAILVLLRDALPQARKTQFKKLATKLGGSIR